METAQKRAIKKAIKQAGGPGKVAAALKISRQAVHKWDRCPVENLTALKLEEMSGVSRYELRPDVFGKRPKSAAA